MEVSQVLTPCILALTYTGKTIRDGMGQATDLSSEDALDLIITNALIIDWSGIYKVLFSYVLFLSSAYDHGRRTLESRMDSSMA